MATKSTAVSAQQTADIVINNKFVESLGAQITEKMKYGLTLPPDYNHTNALMGALLTLKETTDRNGKPLIEACTPASIANSLMDMATMGLSVQKKQGYFVSYGGKCQFMKSYFGSVTIARRYGLKDISAEVIYADDEFEYEIVGAKKVLKSHKQKFTSIGGEIVGAYAIARMNDGTTMMEVMNIKQIKNAWSQGFGYKEGTGTHAKFADQMAKKTVMNRLCKMITNTYGDAFVADADDRIEEAETVDYVAEDVAYDIENGANKAVFEEETEVVEEAPKPAKTAKKQPPAVEVEPSEVPALADDDPDWGV